jgi:hypothetical protein
MNNQPGNRENTIIVRKASGETELFDVSKLQRSLQKAGAEFSIINKITEDINEWIYSGVTTKKIYSRAFSLLRRVQREAAMRYKLKQAIMELGPTGYPFESFIGEIFKKQGFNIEVGVVVEGNCVSHEMDVVATDNKIQHLVECKYSKDQGKNISVQVPLYVRSRVNDIIIKRKSITEYANLSFEGWVITNTRFSLDSIQYSECSGLNLLAWDYPENYGLKEIVEKEKIYPVTILTNLNKKEKQYLLDHGIVTCRQLSENIDSLNSLDINKRKLNRLLNELKAM